MVCAAHADRALTSGRAGSNAEVAEATGTIVFIRGKVVDEGEPANRPAPGGRQVWTMRADGSEQRRLTRGRGWKGSPSGRPTAAGSRMGLPDATRTGRTSSSSTLTAAVSAELTGTAEAQLQYDQYRDWSPDGRRIVFERFDTDPNYAVYIVGADGSGERRLTPGGWPLWSLCGARLVTRAGG